MTEEFHACPVHIQSKKHVQMSDKRRYHLKTEEIPKNPYVTLPHQRTHHHHSYPHPLPAHLWQDTSLRPLPLPQRGHQCKMTPLTRHLYSRSRNNILHPYFRPISPRRGEVDLEAAAISTQAICTSAVAGRLGRICQDQRLQSGERKGRQPAPNVPGRRCPKNGEPSIPESLRLGLAPISRSSLITSDGFSAL